ncbi:Mcm2-7 hexameric complex component [Lobulomyces angularis]|nr:Mcm2-7 hexameric complex component [Lobulomyces angularis]
MLPSMLGGLVTLKGMVTRVSNVKPLATVLAMSCERCGSEMFQGVSSSSVMPLFDCQSNDCKRNNTRGKLVMQTRGSKFLKFQEVKVQELTEQVPMGHIPRSMSVHLYENLARSVNPGDSVTISGIFLPIPYVGFKAIRAGLLTDTFLEAHHIVRVKEQYNSMVITSDMRTKIEELARKDMYQKLSKSIAPEIWGHDDVKKALLLQLIGGSSKETHDGMKIRGDLNICLMGDPGVAKSQLLKHICKIAPRSAYTTGRGSSGVGLTASVIKDPVTDELVLEGGALVLADNGIACIDEFDKMDENDRTAIHEVMEQQTISISKAGITTTLNARTSILAAANPLYGRYNTDKKATENINLPAALLSRFDLLFLILDKPSIENDLRLAKHVSYVHIHNTHPPLDEANEDIVDIPLLKHCISLARTFSPVLPPEVGEYLVHTYIMMRERFEETSDFQYTSARTLLSIIRISTALARLRFSNFVAMADVDEAIRLNDVSKASLLNQGGAKKSDPMSIIYDTILQMSKNNVDGKFRLELKYGEILEKVKIKGFSEENLLDCIRENEENEVWILTGQGSKLKWLLIDE